MEKHQSYYMVIPAEVWESQISAKAMILYGHISVLANKHKYCYANNAYFENVMKISGSTIKRTLKELEDNNLIYREIIYKDDSNEIEQRKIFLRVGIPTNEPSPNVKNELRPNVKNEPRPNVKNDPDNNTRSNKTRSNITDDERRIKIENLYWKGLVPKYPTNRIGNKQHGIKKWKELTDKEMILSIKNLDRYLIAADGYVKSLQNYLTERCFTEQWLKLQEKSKAKKNIKDPNNNFSGDYGIIF